MVPDTLTVSRQMETASAHHAAGRLHDAEVIYRQVLARNPKHPDALHLLGLIAAAAGKFEDAEKLIQLAILAAPATAAFHCNLGIFQQKLGRLDQAIASYQQAIRLKPDYPQAHYNLGLGFREQGRLDQAIKSYECAVALNPNYAEAHNNLGNAWKSNGNVDRAIACYQRALALMPQGAEIHRNLGNALRAKGQIDHAIDSYLHALKISPNNAQFYNDLGNALCAKRQFEQAIDCHRRAVQLKPDFAEALNDLGNAWKDFGNLDEAIASYQQALTIKPAFPQAHNNLGTAFGDKGQTPQAIACYQQALALQPDFAEAHFNLGIAWKADGSLDQAIACHEKAISLKPDYPEAHNNLGNALKDTGRMDDAIACFRRALALKPDYVEAHNNLIFAMHYQPACDSKLLHAEGEKWNRAHAAPLRQFIKPHVNDRKPNRRLKIGYVSADFRKHPVGRFMLPLLAHHDRQAFEVFCYAQITRLDEFTAELRSHADTWRTITSQSDEQLAETIRQDQIDILIDLAMHTADNRLLAFARKPAPLQISYLAYAGSPALETIDYHLTDQYLEPLDDPLSFSKPIRLSATYWCYQQKIDTGPAGDLPALTTGRLTLGCLNNFCKITTDTMETWSKLLRAVPNSQLLLYSPAGGHRDRIHQFFAARGIANDRIEFLGPSLHEDYFATYRRIDIALDTFPYAGGTTTCDALWMGVPVVTLAGRTPVGRAGVSILNNAGLPEFIARDVDDYAQIVLNLASDLPRLAELRRSLRRRIQASSLMNADRYARGIENAYRTIWQTWCAK